MNDEPSIFRKKDFSNILKFMLLMFVMFGYMAWAFGGHLLIVITAIVVFTACFYIPVLVGRKIISENNTIGRALFVNFSAIVLITVIVIILSYLNLLG